MRVPPGGRAFRNDITAVCCLNPDAVLVGTDSGQLVAYSLNVPVMKSFGSSKTADQENAWYLGGLAVWGAAAAPREHVSFSVQFLRLSPDHGTGVVLCGLRSGRVVIFDTERGRALGITEPHRGAISIGYCLPPAAAPGGHAGPSNGDGGGGAAAGDTCDPPTTAAAATADAAPLTQGEGATEPYNGGHWGSAVLACCKSAGAGGGELVVLATSARAALDSSNRRQDRGTTRPQRKSGMRPGPGWEVGEAGGGGYRVEESEGYNFCLPVEVLAATPGQSRVLLSRDVRGYLCSRAQWRLLKSRLVTSSIMIGKEKHSVEAVNGDGTVLVLARKYRGPAVVGPPGRGGAGAKGGGATLPRRAGSSDSGGGEGVEADDDSSVVDDPEGSDDADGGSQMASPSPVAEGSASTATEAAPPPRVSRASASAGRGRSAASDHAWRPNGVRIFAKLRAMFDDRQQQQQQSQDEAVVKARRPPFALYQVVARAKLDGLSVTAITSHPYSSFVLVGLSDGTVAVVLPEGKETEEVAHAHAQSLL